MVEINQSMVYFKCGSCDHVFESDPEFLEVTCPQCGSGNTYRI
ncbi:hypothetical protein [Methanomethylovorans sp. PtaU1.Bin093]|nr:hypothetical protein [Methanomethylovorans sp. PtaU1.Bin093]